MALTFVNQVGAPDGLNQAAPGVFLPESFVRWSQDVLYDRVGQLRRRAPYSTRILYNVDGTTISQPSIDGERVVGVISARNFDNDPCIGLVVSDGTSTRILFYDLEYRNKAVSVLSDAFRTNTIMFSRAALGGGVFIGLLENYGAATSQNKNALYYWRGAMGEDQYAFNNAQFGLTNTIPGVSGTTASSNDKITVTNHGYSNGTPLIITNIGTLTTVNTSTVYYIIDATTNDFKISLSVGGAAIDLDQNTTITFTVHSHVTYTNTITVPSSVTGTTTVSTNIITRSSHGYNNNDVIRFSALSTTTGIVTNTVYYIRDVTTNTFKVSLTEGGSAIDLTGSDATVTFRVYFNVNSLDKGMFVYRNAGSGDDRYIGTVSDWATDGSSITLEKDIIRTFGYASPLVINASGNIRFVNVRPYIHNHGRGLITKTESGTTVTSGDIDSEGEGHFAAADLAGDRSGTRWALYRSSDGEWLGDVYTVASNTALSLDPIFHSDITGMNADEYVARPYTSIYEGNDANKYTGCFNTTYAGYQWYGNNGSAGNENRIVFSAFHDPESVDLSLDAADSIIIPGTQQMRGIATSSSGLVIFLEDKTYLLRGNSRLNFSLEELYPEGCLSAQSIVEYGGGVFWASKTGILFYDGATVRNLVEENLGSYYTDSIKTFDALVRRIYGFVYKDHLFMTFTGLASNYTPIRYEPRYPLGYTDTPIEQGIPYSEWDPDYTASDFLPQNNVPVYWDTYRMYRSLGEGGENTSGTWSAGISLVGATTTSGSATITNISLPSLIGNADVSTDTITLNSHGLSNGNIIRFTNLGTVTNITADTVDYYVINAATNTFQVSTTLSGSARDLTGSTDFVTIKNITPISVGYYVLGPGIPQNTVINSVVNTTEITIEDTLGNSVNATASGTVTLQALPDAPTGNTWNLSLQFVWGPVNFVEAMTFAIYLPTNAITAISNFDFRGFIKLDSVGGTRGYAGVNAVNPDATTGVYPRLIDVDSMLNPRNEHTSAVDSELTENLGKQADLYYKGPDFYLQTKHYSVGDPILRKWFRQVMLSFALLDGGIRMDIVDMEDNDTIDVRKKSHQNWEIFEEITYTWDEFENIALPKLLSGITPTWFNLESQEFNWYNVFDVLFTRRKKKISWRYPSAGFRLYQMNDYRPAKYSTPQRPYSIVVDSWNLGFKPMRSSRV